MWNKEIAQIWLSIPSERALKQLAVVRGTASNTPIDDHFGLQWNLRNTGQSGGTAGVDISALTAWGFSTGKNGSLFTVSPLLRASSIFQIHQFGFCSNRLALLTPST